MRTTITLNDELLSMAHEMTGVTERSALIHDGLKLLIQREAGRRLALLGGSDPQAKAGPRRQSALADQAPSVPATESARIQKSRAAGKR